MQYMPLIFFILMGAIPEKNVERSPSEKPVVQQAKSAAEKPVVPDVDAKPEKRQKAAPKKRKPPKGKKKVEKKKVEKAKKTVTLYDPSVQSQQLGNGFVSWCRTHTLKDVVQIRLAIAAGAGQDPKRLYGRSRLLAQLLKRKLNRLQNPAQPSKELDKGRFEVRLGKEWIQVRAQVTKASLKNSLAKLGQTLKALAKEGVNKRELEKVLKKLSQSAGRFPPISTLERIDAYLFAKHARGRFLRGRKRSFRRLKKNEEVMKGFKSLFRADRMRLLVVGDVACKETNTLVQKSFGQLIGDKVDTFKSVVSPMSAHHKGRFFLTNEVIQLYKFRKLTREDLMPLLFIHYVAEKELMRAFRKKFGELFPMKTALQTFPHAGYLFFAVPAPAPRQRQMRHLLQKTLGHLMTYPYEPRLEGRIKAYKKSFLLHIRQKEHGMSSLLELLFAQMLLPSKIKGKAPFSQREKAVLGATVRGMTLKGFREHALQFLKENVSLNRVQKPFSLQRIGLFIATLLLVWFSIDLFLRRGRRFD